VHRSYLVRAAIAMITFVAGIVLVQSPASAASPWPPDPFKGLQSGKCLDIPNSNTANNVRVVIWNCHPTIPANQLWTFEPTDNGWYNIENLATSKCLAALNGGTANNTPIIQFDCNNGDNEEWRDVFVTSNNWPGGYFELQNRKNSNKCLTVKNADVDSGTQLLLFDCNGGRNQGWLWG
jgi:hypothetical protein